MQVKKQKFDSLQQAIEFGNQKLYEGYGNVRFITAKSILAKRYDITGDRVQVRYW